MPKGTVQCVAFDVDDTLYLEREYVRSGFMAIAPWAESATGTDSFAERAWAEFESGNRGDIFDRAFRGAGKIVEPSMVSELVRRYRQHTPAITLLDDARTCLNALSGRARLAAITDGPGPSQHAKVNALGLRAWLAPIVVTADLGEGMGKPHPRSFLQVERATGYTGAACVYVGDNPTKDFSGPAALGWRTVRVRREMGLHWALPSGPDVEYEVADLGALTNLLRLPS